MLGNENIVGDTMKIIIWVAFKKSRHRKKKPIKNVQILQCFFLINYFDSLS